MNAAFYRRGIVAVCAGVFCISSAPASGMSAKDIFAQVARSVVVVLALDYSGKTIAQGSGVVVGENEVATNCHVISDANKIVVRQAADSGGGETYRMDSRILAQDDERDLCLLFVDELSEPPAAPVVAMGAAKQLAVGEDVYSVGAPKGLELSFSRGIVSQLRGIHGKRGAPLVQTDAAISPGSSGGGLFNENAELVGITAFKWKGENLNFAIPTEWIGDLREKGRAQLAGKELRRAIEYNELDKAALLLEKYADINVKDDDGWTLLHWAASNNAAEIAKLLIDRGADIQAKDNQGWTPMHWAMYKNAPEIANVLIDRGANIQAKIGDGWMPLHWAARAGDSAAVKWLIDSGLDVNAKDERGQTPLHSAAYYNHSTLEDTLEVANLLIDRGADIQTKDKWGRTPLHSAAYSYYNYNTLEFAKLLIDRGADIQAKDKWGETPLDLAVYRNAPEVVKLLIESGADVNAKNKWGETPMDEAISEEHTEIQSLLRRHGGWCNVNC